MADSPARTAADLAALLDPDDPLALIARERLAAAAGGFGPRLRDAAATSDPADIPRRVGTHLRDASVKPQPQDFLPPINAGSADPHSAAVRAIEVGSSTYDEAVAERRRQGEA